MSLLPVSADLKARVARLKLCNCKNNVWTDPHLIIELDHIPVQRGEATAISYVWGEFDRRDVLIGHPPGESDDIIRMNLGMEWVIQDVIHRLAEIATDKPIWMDQLCIPQNDEEIRKVLASIVTIYKTFEVAVLLPGYPCACLPSIVKELEARATREGKDRTPDGNVDTNGKTSDFCLNVCPLSFWMSRMWPFQELGFSQSVRCVLVSKDVAECILSCNMPTKISNPEDLRLSKSVETHLQPYAAMWFRRAVSARVKRVELESTAVEIAWQHLHRNTVNFIKQINNAIKYFDGSEWTTPLSKWSNWIVSIGAFEHLKLYQFLSGEVIQRSQELVLEQHPIYNFSTRLPSLQRNIGTPRKATHARDYVIAFFAEVEGYSPPPNYKNEDLPVLMQHAMDWHRCASYDIVMLSTAPQGLFIPDADKSFLWRPAYYLSTDRVRTSSDVYQTLTGTMVLLKKVGTCDFLPLSYQPRGRIPLSVTAKSWESFHGDFADPDSVLDVAAQLKNTIKGWKKVHWTSTTLRFTEELMDHYIFGISIPTDTVRLLRLCACLLGKELVLTDDPGGPYRMAELHLAFYECVCRILYLDAAFCREKGVKLMFSPPTEYRQHTRVGLCRGDVKLGGEQAHDSNQTMAHQSLTLGIQDVRFEAERIEDYEGKPAYRVFGVWVDIEDDLEDNIGAVYHPGNRSMDALLL